MSSISTIEWPPQYTVKRHRLARHVKLRTAGNVLMITVPFRFNVKHLPQILEENKSWITKQLAKLTPIKQDWQPATIVFPSMAQTWQVTYCFANQQKLSLSKRLPNRLELTGNTIDVPACNRKLLSWIKQQARIYLTAQIKMISEGTQLPFSKVSIRNQQTLWGSCTSRRAISLNYKLIFLPERLVNHIIIHELSHTKFLNHSPNFWQIVATFDPAWQIHRREMRKADQYVPSWV